MKKIILSLLFLLFFLTSYCQKGYDKWSPEVLKLANTASDVNYLTDNEKEVVLLSNLARYDGLLFAESFLEDYLHEKKSTKFTRSLFNDLKKVKGLPMLESEYDLYKIASGHAKVSGNKGTTGHQRFEKRFDPVMGKYNAVAENCAYGFSDAIDIVLQLLIDEGIQNLGHRENILNPDYNSIGVSILPHKSYRHNCVMDFGRNQNNKFKDPEIINYRL